MTTGRTARDRARAELTREIKDAARRQLAIDGAERLSLRAVSRELGMVSSALYRYFPSRDDLLTELIIDAYDALGSHAEAAAKSRPDPRAAWLAVCQAIRSWARAHPQEYALIYGSPVAGYQAPASTIRPAGRVAFVLLGILAQAQASGVLTPPAGSPEPSALLASRLQILAGAAPGLPPQILARTPIAWTQLFGMINFELFGQFAGWVDPADEFFAEATGQLATFLGLS
ncbi:TetR/AcrR family transcriptional regulator [Kribbella sp. CA-293567]|uniref:TetR/AcrR family transcriptional regulator n=1 Tax=Kribbella sp. CA-293567 TaxID=3002436 RepID=UPI0022DDFFFA|nr:TetR/AcrR family transcriptional regulator [Kribbella sp. CA-293567]WBQ05333.1 TetR/AcrR family transcriptional regulator [Kribbella sp. CA-293567]